MEISAKADYSIRALAELAAAGGGPLRVSDLAASQDIPARFLQNLLLQLRRRELVRSQRGPEGGYRLARPAAEITLADAFRAADGPLANVRGERPDTLDYGIHTAAMRGLWLALRVSMRAVLEEITIEDLVAGRIPPPVDGHSSN